VLEEGRIGGDASHFSRLNLWVRLGEMMETEGVNLQGR